MNKFEEAWDKLDTRFDKELEELDNKARRVAREFENRRRALFAARDGQRTSATTSGAEGGLQGDGVVGQAQGDLDGQVSQFRIP